MVNLKGNAVKIRSGLATVTGDKGFTVPLGKPGKAKPEDDPEAGKPAIHKHKPLLSEGKGGAKL